MNWTYCGIEVTELPEGAIGFVYCISYTNGTRYIGSKLAISERRVKPLVGMRKNAVRKKTVESKWKTYVGSSSLNEGLEILSKEILWFSSNKRTLTYLEAKEIFSRGCIESDEYNNANCLGSFFSNCLDGLIKL